MLKAVTQIENTNAQLLLSKRSPSMRVIQGGLSEDFGRRSCNDDSRPWYLRLIWMFCPFVLNLVDEFKSILHFKLEHFGRTFVTIGQLWLRRVST